MSKIETQLELLEQELKCVICLSIFDDPHSLPCNHQFCHDCIAESFRVKSQCPLCKLPTIKRAIVKNQTLANVIAAYRSLKDTMAKLPDPVPPKPLASGSPMRNSPLKKRGNPSSHLEDAVSPKRQRRSLRFSDSEEQTPQPERAPFFVSPETPTPARSERNLRSRAIPELAQQTTPKRPAKTHHDTGTQTTPSVTHTRGTSTTTTTTTTTNGIVQFDPYIRTNDNVYIDTDKKRVRKNKPNSTAYNDQDDDVNTTTPPPPTPAPTNANTTHTSSTNATTNSTANANVNRNVNRIPNGNTNANANANADYSVGFDTTVTSRTANTNTNTNVSPMKFDATSIIDWSSLKKTTTKSPTTTSRYMPSPAPYMAFYNGMRKYTPAQNKFPASANDQSPTPVKTAPTSPLINGTTTATHTTKTNKQTTTNHTTTNQSPTSHIRDRSTSPTTSHARANHARANTTSTNHPPLERKPTVANKTNNVQHNHTETTSRVPPATAPTNLTTTSNKLTANSTSIHKFTQPNHAATTTNHKPNKHSNATESESDVVATSTVQDKVPLKSKCKKVVILATSLDPTILASAKTILKELGGSMVTKYSSEVSHVVAGCAGSHCARRTIKYCLGVVEGKWVVSSEWLMQSSSAAYWLAEQPFEVEGDTVTKGGPKAARETKEKGLPPLFSNCHIYLHGEFNTPTKAEIKKLLQLGGAQVSTKIPAKKKLTTAPATTTEVIICNLTTFSSLTHEEAERVKGLGRMVADARWILDCVSFYRILPFLEYELSA